MALKNRIINFPTTRGTIHPHREKERNLYKENFIQAVPFSDI